MRVLTICSDQQMGEHSSHLAQPPRGPACNRDVAVLPAAPDQSGYPQTGAQLLRANAESVQRPSLCDPMLPRGGPALLSAGLCSPPSLPPPHTNHRFPTLQGSRLSAESSRAGRSRSPALSSLTGPSGQVRGPAGRVLCPRGVQGGCENESDAGRHGAQSQQTSGPRSTSQASWMASPWIPPGAESEMRTWVQVVYLGGELQKQE